MTLKEKIERYFFSRGFYKKLKNPIYGKNEQFYVEGLKRNKGFTIFYLEEDLIYELRQELNEKYLVFLHTEWYVDVEQNIRWFTNGKIFSDNIKKAFEAVFDWVQNDLDSFNRIYEDFEVNKPFDIYHPYKKDKWNDIKSFLFRDDIFLRVGYEKTFSAYEDMMNDFYNDSRFLNLNPHRSHWNLSFNDNGRKLPWLCLSPLKDGRYIIWQENFEDISNMKPKFIVYLDSEKDIVNYYYRLLKDEKFLTNEKKKVQNKVHRSTWRTS